MLIVFCVFEVGLCYGQNYACIQTGMKHYFNNEQSYVRGIRIDSQRIYADSTIYYPFRTRREKLEVPHTFDEYGGCWIGKKVTRRNDGKFLFENIWGNAIVINTFAAVGESWLFYEDTTNVYYKAELASVSTREIYGVTDSVKVIKIRAFDRDTGYIPLDPVNELRLTISKNYGFYEVFDFFLFPHRLVAPDSYSGTFPIQDYFFRQCGSQQFVHEIINTETDNDLYDFAVGDIVNYVDPCGDFLVEGYTSRVDTIVSKEVISSTQVQYVIHRKSYVDCSSKNISVNVDGILTTGTRLNFVDTVKMPEETGIQTMYFYCRTDSTMCYKSPRYWWRSGSLFNEFEPCESGASYKMGLGKTSHYRCYYYPIERLTRYGSLSFAYKNGIACGSALTFPSAISGEQAGVGNIVVYPNPINDEFAISGLMSGVFRMRLLDVTGRIVLKLEIDKIQDRIDVRELHSGVYVLIVEDEVGRRYQQAVSILH